MNVDLIRLYRDILDAQGIQFLLLSASAKQIESIDYGFRNKMFQDYDYKKYLHDIIHRADDSHTLFFRDDFQLNYCFFEFPEILQDEYQARYAIIGPVIFHPITNSELDNVIQEHQLPASLKIEVLEFYNRISTLPSHDFWISLLMPLLRPLFGNDNNYNYVDLADTFKQEQYKNDIRDLHKDNSPSFDAIADRYAIEDQIIHAVAQGNVNDALDRYHRFRQFNLSARTPDRLRNQKNWLIILNTNLRKAARMAEVHPFYIDELSREYAIKIESTNSISQLQNMSITMLRKYAMLAHNYSTREYSSLIKKCIEYIRFHYQEPLSLEILAKHCAVTPSYLSIQFRRETGNTVTEYIHKIRIQHAILLLNSTQSSIQEIASQCGFPDSNYFTRTFKKAKGITPNAYRKSIK